MQASACTPWHLLLSVTIEYDVQSGGLELVRMMGYFPYDFEPEGTVIVEGVALVRFVIICYSR